jgi:DNA-binding NarL/FixJ family response regulator
MLTRECLLQMLATREDRLHVRGAAAAAEAAIGKADLVLLNIKSTPVDDKTVRAQLTDIRRRFGQVPVIVITDLDEGELAAGAFRNDVRGYIPTSMSGDFVLAAIDLVLAGGVALPEPLLARWIGIPTAERQPPCEEEAAECDDCPYLTSRETDVLARLRKGKPNKIIAYELNISESTVKVHVRNIMKKMRATNRTQVAVLMQAAAAHPQLTPEAVPA